MTIQIIMFHWLFCSRLLETEEVVYNEAIITLYVMMLVGDKRRYL